MSILSWINILKDLSEKELSSLEVLSQERFIKSWDLLFSEWDEANSMYLLKQWKIEVFLNKNSQEVILWEIEAEEILWEMALFWNKENRMASARALVDSIVVVFLEFAIKELIEKHPELLEKIKWIIKSREEENKKLI